MPGEFERKKKNVGWKCVPERKETGFYFEIDVFGHLK